MTKKVWFSAAGDPVTWDATPSMTVAEALAAGVPREVIEASWREVDAQLGTNVADDLIRDHFTDPAEQRNEAQAWKNLYLEEGRERIKLERALTDIWSLPPTAIATYHEQVGDIARQALEPGAAAIKKALREATPKD